MFLKSIPDYSLFDPKRFYRPMGGRIFKTIPIETCRRKDEARRKWLGMETLVQLKEVQRDGCSSIEEHDVQIKELMALKKECRTRWREQGKGDDECARLWSAYCLLVMQSCTAC